MGAIPKDKEILWTPEFYGGSSFGITLRRDIAKSRLDAIASPEKISNLNRHVVKSLLFKEGFNWPNPYQFEKDSCLAVQMTVGDGGRWLDVSRNQIDRLKTRGDRPLRFTSHNIDNPWDMGLAMRLFSIYVRYGSDLAR